MGDEDAEYKVKYVDVDEGSDEQTEFNWISRPGKALVTYQNGCTYEGDFNGEKQKHGQGVYTWVEADEDEGFKKIASYEGSYADGKKNGVGKMVFPNGDVYHGEWKDNKMEGEGTYTYAKTKDIYSGTWVNNKKQGEGCYEYGEDSSKLQGTWENGSFVSGDWLLEGAGSYSGKFQSGKPVGPGTFKYANGITQDGEYVAPPAGEDDDEDAPAGDPKWNGKPVYSSVA